MKQKLLFIICFLLCLYGNAQSVSTQGKEFYITFPKIDIAPETSERWGLQTIQIQVTSLVNTIGSIINPLTGYNQAFAVTAGTATTVIVPRGECMNGIYERVNLNGLIVTTADTCSVYAMSVQNYTSDASNILPTNTLGTDYMVSSYHSAYTSISNAEFAIIATADNTDIQIMPTATTTGGRIAGQPFNVTLNRGQSYNVASITGDLTGSLISVTNGCRPIAVFSGNDVGYIPDTYGTGDYLFEQLFPVNTLGKKFIVANLKSRNSTKVKIAAPYNNTSITINGSIAATINKGQHYEFEIDAPLTGSVYHPGGDGFHVVTDASGNVYTSGNYTNAAGYFYVAKWDGTTWAELGSGAGALNATATIASIASDNAGNIYIAGAYSGTASNGYVAKWDGSSWTRVGALNTNDYISSVTCDATGNVYASGYFTNANGYKYVAKWNGTSWTELGTGGATLNANNGIRSLTADGAGNIYATGNFTNTNGSKYVAKWDGTSWTELGTTSFFANRYIPSVKSDAAGNVYAETFISGGGNGIAKWDGVAWTFLTGGASPSGNLAMDKTGNVYAFSSYNIIRWNGTSWIDLGIGARSLGSMGTYSASINSIAAYNTNAVYVVGNFYNGVAWWNGAYWKDASNLTMPSPMAYMITTSNPVQVMQYATGKYYDETKGPVLAGDPTMLTVAPLEQTTTDVVFLLPDIGAITNHYITITVKTADAANTMLDGINIGANFSIVGANPIYSIAQLNAASGTHRLSNPGGIVACAYGFGQSQGYGYNVGSLANKINVSFTVANDCNGQKIFTVDTPDSIATFIWNFGDGTANDTTGGSVTRQVHNYTSGGNYNVTLTAVKASPNNCPEINTTAATLSITVTILPAPGAISGNNNPCVGNEYLYSIQDAGYGPGTSFNWILPAGWVIDSGANSRQIYVKPGSTAGLITVSISIPGGCVSATSSLPVTPVVNISPVVNITASQNNICSDSPVRFIATTADSANQIISCNFKVNGNSIQNSNTDTFIITSLLNGDKVSCDVTVTGTVCQNTFIAISDTITVAVIVASTPKILIESGANLCEQNSITLNAGNGFRDYLWNTGDRAVMINVNNFGNYSVRVTDANGCQSADTIEILNNCTCQVHVPIVFTPNSDGFYDKWEISAGNCISRINVSVYNRWGGLVYHSDNYKNDWTGLWQSKPLPDATYYYIIQAYNVDGHIQPLKGNVTIMR